VLHPGATDGHLAQNVGMDDKYAYISRHHLAANDANERLHAAGLGAFFRPSQLGEAGLTPDQLPSLLRRRVV
jgi:hypothetical protein